MEGHLTLCPLALAGFHWCPGCGVGRSMILALHGQVVWPPIVRTKLVKVRQKYYFLHQFCMRFESKNLQEGQRSILVSVL